MALFLVDYTFDSNNIYGVVNGYTWEQIANLIASDPYSLEDYFDPSFEASSFAELQFSLADRTDVGGFVYGDEDTDLLTVGLIRGGQGGISTADASEDDLSVAYYVLSEYVYFDDEGLHDGDILYARVDFQPNTFLTGVVAPVSSWALSSPIPLAFLAVTFLALGSRVLRRITRALGRGR